MLGKYSNIAIKKNELETALSWVNRALSMLPKPDSEAMDTKANLLYKLGRKQDGIVFEEQAIALFPGNKEFLEGLQKMKQGLPTWPSR